MHVFLLEEALIVAVKLFLSLSQKIELFTHMASYIPCGFTKASELHCRRGGGGGGDLT